MGLHIVATIMHYLLKCSYLTIHFLVAIRFENSLMKVVTPNKVNMQMFFKSLKKITFANDFNKRIFLVTFASRFLRLCSWF
jgi:hypothetical protein